uniref:High-affinity choline transporter 1 (inferred by orthology to a C. elegans protein) n=1 Tax=Anisakis simplex TaxID=6269 RepID=A0A0M3J9G9_ANISI
LSGGEPLLSFPALIHFPMYEEYTLPDGTVSGTQYFPFRTMAMFSSFIACVGVSLLTEHLFKSGKLSVEMDFLTCVVNIPPERIALPSDTSFNVSCETLAMQKTKDADGSGERMITTNGFLGPCTPVNEHTSLHDAKSRDYLTLNHH